MQFNLIHGGSQQMHRFSGAETLEDLRLWVEEQTGIPADDQELLCDSVPLGLSLDMQTKLRDAIKPAQRGKSIVLECSYYDSSQLYSPCGTVCGVGPNDVMSFNVVEQLDRLVIVEDGSKKLVGLLCPRCDSNKCWTLIPGDWKIPPLATFASVSQTTRGVAKTSPPPLLRTVLSENQKSPDALPIRRVLSRQIEVILSEPLKCFTCDEPVEMKGRFKTLVACKNPKCLQFCAWCRKLNPSQRHYAGDNYCCPLYIFDSPLLKNYWKEYQLAVSESSRDWGSYFLFISRVIKLCSTPAYLAVIEHELCDQHILDLCKVIKTHQDGCNSVTRWFLPRAIDYGNKI